MNMEEAHHGASVLPTRRWLYPEQAGLEAAPHGHPALVGGAGPQRVTLHPPPPPAVLAGAVLHPQLSTWDIPSGWKLSGGRSSLPRR